MSFVRQVGSFPFEIPVRDTLPFLALPLPCCPRLMPLLVLLLQDFFPDEQSAVGTECVDMAQRMMQVMTDKGSQLHRISTLPFVALPLPRCQRLMPLPVVLPCHRRRIWKFHRRLAYSSSVRSSLQSVAETVRILVEWNFNERFKLQDQVDPVNAMQVINRFVPVRETLPFLALPLPCCQRLMPLPVLLPCRSHRLAKKFMRLHGRLVPQG